MITVAHPCHGEPAELDTAAEPDPLGFLVPCPNCGHAWYTRLEISGRRHWYASSGGLTIPEYRAMEERLLARGWPIHTPRDCEPREQPSG